jgi:hypothetical protein
MMMSPQPDAKGTRPKVDDGSVTSQAVAGHGQGTRLLAAAVGAIDLEVLRDGAVLAVTVTKEAPDTDLGIILAGGATVIVNGVAEDGAAAGVVKANDLLTGVCGKNVAGQEFATPVTDHIAATDLLKSAVGEIILSVVREDEALTLTVTKEQASTRTGIKLASSVGSIGGCENRALATWRHAISHLASALASAPPPVGRRRVNVEIMDRGPPPGAPPGGIYITKEYCGAGTWLISIIGSQCFICCCTPFCPCDRRLVYLTEANGQQYSPQTGKRYKETCGCVYCFNETWNDYHQASVA